MPWGSEASISPEVPSSSIEKQPSYKGPRGSGRSHWRIREHMCVYDGVPAGHGTPFHVCTQQPPAGVLSPGGLCPGPVRRTLEGVQCCLPLPGSPVPQRCLCLWESSLERVLYLLSIDCAMRTDRLCVNPDPRIRTIMLSCKFWSLGTTIYLPIKCNGKYH